MTDDATTGRTEDSSTWLLGGPLSPIGWNVGFIEAPLGVVTGELLRWRRGLGRWCRVDGAAGSYPGCLHRLRSPPSASSAIGWTSTVSSRPTGP
ncbi:MAG: hypothetical protein GEV11_05060 [Streptosporangiales bacterium]|nr:hypothetical protein [Streptosporangiales bacterium]